MKLLVSLALLAFGFRVFATPAPTNPSGQCNPMGVGGVEDRVDYQLAGESVSNRCGSYGVMLSGVGHLRINANGFRDGTTTTYCYKYHQNWSGVKAQFGDDIYVLEHVQNGQGELVYTISQEVHDESSFVIRFKAIGKGKLANISFTSHFRCSYDCDFSIPSCSSVCKTDRYEVDCP